MFFHNGHMWNRIVRRLKGDFPYFCRKCLKIRTKEGDIEPFILNKAQLYTLECLQKQEKLRNKVRLVIVKGRQQGISTFIQAYYFWKTIYRRGMSTFILTHEAKATKNLFRMTKRFYEYFQFKNWLITKEDSQHSLFFEGIDSGYEVGTAGSKSVGRSQTIQMFHGSEAAFWQHADEHAAGIIQTIPDKPNTYIIYESTANGIGNFFYQRYKNSLDPETDYNLVFIPWYWQDEYKREVGGMTLTKEEKELMEIYGLNEEQISWRRNKIKELHTTGIDGDLKFKQEYPSTAEEAFIATNLDCYLDVNLVKKAMDHTEFIEPYGPLILGVDPSGSGKDKTGFCLRKGRTVEKIWTINNKSTMDVVGAVVILLKEKPIDYVFVDKIGVGHGVYDRLIEMGYSSKVHKVSASEMPTNKELFHNLRSEMWAKLKDWLEDHPCTLPDNPELLNQMVSVGYKADSKGRLLMEPKDEIKKEGRPSPDLADALTYTFAKPVALNKDMGKIAYADKGVV